MSKVTPKKPPLKRAVTLQVVNPYSAGIDVGDRELAVAVAEGLCPERVRTFGTMSRDLLALCDWLLQCGVETVAMESTGVYWKPLFGVLVRAGLEVYLVNAASVQNVTGRKSDESDAMWLQRLHACGLLRSSYLPDGVQAVLRTLVRYRRTLVQDSSRCVNRMQKALEQMNIKFHTVIRDITGKTGCAVVEAILQGERCAENFLPLIDPRVRAERTTIVRSLEGTFSEEQLFLLQDSYELYQHYQQRIAGCDQQIEKYLQAYAASLQGKQAPAAAKPQPSKGKARGKNRPCLPVGEYLQRIHGVDVLKIYGLSETCALELLAETGTDLGKWKDDKHFVSWLNLCPNNKISGGKLISSALLKNKPNSASEAFRRAANAVQKSNHWLGDYFRRMKAKGGNRYAIVATANKIATIYYKMVRYKQEFNPVELQAYQHKYKQAKVAYLERKLAELKKQVV